MKTQRQGPAGARRWLGMCCCWLAGLASAGAPVESRLFAEEKKAAPAAGNLVTAHGTAFSRGRAGAPWAVLKKDEGVAADALIVGLPGAAIDSANKAVRLSFFADLDESSPFPIKEAAVLLRSGAKVDLDLTLDRGRVDVVNRKEQGSAHVHLRFHHQGWDIDLQEPGTRVALELFGRWAPGTRFARNSKNEQAPQATLIMLVLQGKAALREGKNEVALKAPPGPAFIQWDSVTGCDEAPGQMDKLPLWATPEPQNSALAKERLERLEQFREMVLKKPVTEALTDALDSEDAGLRRLGVIACGAFDELALLGDALNSGKHPGLWDHTVVTLRHWLGRRAGQDALLYQTLVEHRKMSPAHAETIVNLLHSFGAADLAHPELYETLIEYLKHKTLGIRGLAYWHLYRLAPAGRGIAYNPHGTPEERERGYEEWKKLIPTGQFPPKPKRGEKEKP